MFANNYTGTLAVIDAQIKQLEFAFMVVGSSQSLLIELGNAYKIKMELIKIIENDNFIKNKSYIESHYSSKIDTEKKQAEVRGR